MSMKPGARVKPSRSISSAPLGEMSPTALMRSPVIPIDADLAGAPVPSTTRAPRSTKSMSAPRQSMDGRVPDVLHRHIIAAQHEEVESDEAVALALELLGHAAAQLQGVALTDRAEMRHF